LTSGVPPTRLAARCSPMTAAPVCS